MEMEAFVQGWGLTVAFCLLITIVFVAAMAHLARELRWVRMLTDHLGAELVAPQGKHGKGDLQLEAIRDEAIAIATARDPAWAQKQVRSWQMRAQRLEHALSFWTDFLRQPGPLRPVFRARMLPFF